MHKYLVGGHECAFQSCSLSARWGVGRRDGWHFRLELVRHWRNEKGTGAEMRPAIVSGIVNGHAPVSYWPIFFSLSLATVPEVFYRGELANWRSFSLSLGPRGLLKGWIGALKFWFFSLPFSFRDASLVRVQNLLTCQAIAILEISLPESPSVTSAIWRHFTLKSKFAIFNRLKRENKTTNTEQSERY